MGYVVLREVGARPNRLPPVEVLLHSLIANFLVLVIIIVEAVRSLRVLLEALVGNRVLHMPLVLVRTRQQLRLLDSKEV